MHQRWEKPSLVLEHGEDHRLEGILSRGKNKYVRPFLTTLKVFGYSRSVEEIHVGRGVYSDGTPPSFLGVQSRKIVGEKINFSLLRSKYWT